MLEVISRLASSLTARSISTTPRAGLSYAVSKETWASDGYLDQVPLLPASALPPLLSQLAELEAQAGGRLPAQLLNPHFSCPAIASLCQGSEKFETVQ